MEILDAVKILRAHNEWRRYEGPIGKGPEMQSPALIGKAIDVVCNALEGQNERANEVEFIDLGLSVKWATCNVGASSPDECGNYLTFDEAKEKYGDSVPSKEQWQELQERCAWEWVTLLDVKGYKVTGPNGNSIFLPAAGYRGGTYLFDVGSDGLYWSSSLDTDNPDDAWNVDFNSGDVSRYYNIRYFGQSVRLIKR